MNQSFLPATKRAHRRFGARDERVSRGPSKTGTEGAGFRTDSDLRKAINDRYNEACKAEARMGEAEPKVPLGTP